MQVPADLKKNVQAVTVAHRFNISFDKKLYCQLIQFHLRICMQSKSNNVQYYFGWF